MDGWEDDDDLDIDSDGGGFPHEDLVPSDTEQGGGGEWSFDDDVVLETDDEPTTDDNNKARESMINLEKKEAAVAESTRMKQGAQEINQVNNNDELQESGDWSFDDDEILDDGMGDEDLKPPTQPLVNEKIEQKPPSDALFRDRLATENVTSGTNKATEGADHSSHVAVGITNVSSHPPPDKPPVDEWSFEDDSFLDAAENESPALPRPPSNPNAKQEATFQSLVRYLESLPALLPSLNAVLEAEYNTYHHAVELSEYYKSRPRLYDYTLDTELPRMDYQVVLPGHPQERLTDKYQVQQYLLSKNKDDILIRSANQSLLADLLAQLTGPDCFIQHQYLATAVATSCQFVLHPSFVECHCTLTLSLPSATGDRLDVARLLVSIDFAQPPAVNYHLHKVERILDDFNILRETAAFLSSMDQDLFVEDDTIQTSDDVVRDAFLVKLSQTQQFAKDSHAGLSSAWKQIDSIANVSKKMNFLKQGLVPNDVLAAARHEEALASRPPPPPPPTRDPIPSVAPSVVPPPPPPPNRPPPPPGSGSRDRPAPILGGLLRTGWNRLAQTVTLPDDVDTIPNEPTPTVPKLYRPEANQELDNARNAVSAQGGTTIDDAAPLPFPQPIEQRASPLQQPLAKPDARQEIVGANAPEEDFQDGWGDDDLDLNVDNDDDVTNIDDETEMPKPPPPPPQRPSQPIAASTAVAPPPPKRAQESTPDVKPPSPLAASRVDVLPQASFSNYNPEDDIVPTRKRWVNPRPGNRQLRV